MQNCTVLLPEGTILQYVYHNTMIPQDVYHNTTILQYVYHNTIIPQDVYHNTTILQYVYHNTIILQYVYHNTIIPQYIYHNTIIAERRERSERSEANNRVLFEIPRYLYIYICLSATCIAQDRAHLTQVLSRRPLCIWNTAAVRSTTSRSRPFARYGRRRQFS